MTINEKSTSIAGKVVSTIITYAIYIVLLSGVAVGLFFWGTLVYDWIHAIISR